MRSVRIFYKKTGNMKFISHLDMNRFMIKMVRMSGIPVWYSEGFNPHPYITFALPLSLGFESEYEVVDLRLLDDDFSNEGVLSALKKNMCDGIEIFECSDPVMKAGEVAFADFKILFDSLSDEIRNKFEHFLASDTIITEKKNKKGALKEIDLKPFIKDYKTGDSAFYLTLSAGGSTNLNPKLLLETFCKNLGLDLPPYSIVRTALYDKNMQLFK